MRQPFYVAVAGLIGIGKSTLARGLADLFDGHLILEEYDKNPFLADQYAQKGDAALASQLFFLMSRLKQLDLDELIGYDICVSDYIFQKDRLFAQINLNEPQLQLYDNISHRQQSSMIQPSVVVYLQDSLEHCLEHISSRGRDYEQVITAEWLEQFDLAYNEMFKDWSICPVIELDCRELDLRERDTHMFILKKIKSLFDQIDGQAVASL